MFLHPSHWNSKNHPYKDKILNKCQLIILFSQNSLSCLPELVVRVNLVTGLLCEPQTMCFVSPPHKTYQFCQQTNIHKTGVL